MCTWRPTISLDDGSPAFTAARSHMVHSSASVFGASKNVNFFVPENELPHQQPIEMWDFQRGPILCVVTYLGRWTRTARLFSMNGLQEVQLMPKRLSLGFSSASFMATPCCAVFVRGSHCVPRFRMFRISLLRRSTRQADHQTAHRARA